MSQAALNRRLADFYETRDVRNTQRNMLNQQLQSQRPAQMGAPQVRPQPGVPAGSGPATGSTPFGPDRPTFRNHLSNPRASVTGAAQRAAMAQPDWRVTNPNAANSRLQHHINLTNPQNRSTGRVAPRVRQIGRLGTRFFGLPLAALDTAGQAYNHFVRGEDTATSQFAERAGQSFFGRNAQGTDWDDPLVQNHPMLPEALQMQGWDPDSLAALPATEQSEVIFQAAQLARDLRGDNREPREVSGQGDDDLAVDADGNLIDSGGTGATSIEMQGVMDALGMQAQQRDQLMAQMDSDIEAMRASIANRYDQASNDEKALLNWALQDLENQRVAAAQGIDTAYQDAVNQITERADNITTAAPEQAAAVLGEFEDGMAGVDAAADPELDAMAGALGVGLTPVTPEAAAVADQLAAEGQAASEFDQRSADIMADDLEMLMASNANQQVAQQGELQRLAAGQHADAVLRSGEQQAALNQARMQDLAGTDQMLFQGRQALGMNALDGFDQLAALEAQRAAQEANFAHEAQMLQDTFNLEMGGALGGQQFRSQPQSDMVGNVAFLANQVSATTPEGEFLNFAPEVSNLATTLETLPAGNRTEALRQVDEALSFIPPEALGVLSQQGIPMSADQILDAIGYPR